MRAVLSKTPELPKILLWSDGDMKWTMIYLFLNVKSWLLNVVTAWFPQICWNTTLYVSYCIFLKSRVSSSNSNMYFESLKV